MRMTPLQENSDDAVRGDLEHRAEARRLKHAATARARRPREVRAPNGLPEASRLRAARVCVRRRRRGRCKVEVHLPVRIGVEPVLREGTMAVADTGCADTLTMHDGLPLTLPDHEEALEKALDAQRAMSGCVRGSRRWKESLECLRTQRCAMQKTACAALDTRKHNGAAGAASITSAGAKPPRNEPRAGTADGDGARGHKQCSQSSI